MEILYGIQVHPDFSGENKFEYELVQVEAERLGGVYWPKHAAPAISHRNFLARHEICLTPQDAWSKAIGESEKSLVRERTALRKAEDAHSQLVDAARAFLSL